MTKTRRPTGLATVLLAVFASAAAQAGGLPDAYRILIIDADNEEAMTPPLAAVAASRAAHDREVCDVIAEVLWRNQEPGRRWNDAGFYALRALAYCPDAGRYWNVMKAARTSTKADGAIKQYKQYLAQFPRATPEQYQPGALDLDKLREDRLRNGATRQPTPEQALALKNLSTNASIDEVLTSAGEPTLVAMHGFKIKQGFGLEVRQLYFYYRGIGRVAFDFQRDSGWHLYSLVADPMAFEEFMPYRPRAAELGMPDANQLALIQLMTGHASSVKASAQNQYRADSASPEYLDTAAEKLLHDHVAIANSGSTDAYAWLCNVLAHQGGKRYAAVLDSVAATTTDEKLKRFAQQKIESAEGANPRPYVPGSISLEEQAKKYPTMYPQIDFVTGFL